MPAAPTCFALYCDASGRLLERIRDDLGVWTRGTNEFTEAVAQVAVDDARAFLARIWDERTVEDCRLPFETSGGTLYVHCDGTRFGERLLITASVGSNARSLGLLREDDRYYTELTRLNNQLVTMQREAVKQNVQLERANEEKNRFIGMLVHDLRQPLWVIEYFSKHMLDRPDTPIREYEKILRLVHQNSEFMTRLLGDTLDIASIEAGQLRLDRVPTDVAPLVRQAVEANGELAAQRGIRITMEVEDLPPVDVDPVKLMQVVNSLLSNATKYSPDDGHIVVTIGLVDGHVQLTVQDQGKGIPRDELKRLFRPFGTTSVRTEGGEKSTGLGLAICRRIVEGHGGHIWVEDTGPEGTTFAMRLPLG